MITVNIFCKNNSKVVKSLCINFLLDNNYIYVTYPNISQNKPLGVNTSYFNFTPFLNNHTFITAA